MAARVVLKNITSPPNLILLLMSSGNLQPYTCKSMFHTLFHLLLKSQHNLHYDIACIMFHIIFSHPHSPLVILIDEYVISSNTLLYHNCIHHSVTLLHLLSLSIHSPPSVQSSQSPPHDPICPQVQGGCYQRYLEVLSLFPSFRLPYPHNPPSTHPPHANTSTAIQDGRIMNCSWRLRGARETKGFLLSCYSLTSFLFAH